MTIAPLYIIATHQWISHSTHITFAKSGKDHPSTATAQPIKEENNNLDKDSEMPQWQGSSSGKKQHTPNQIPPEMEFQAFSFTSSRGCQQITKIPRHATHSTWLKVQFAHRENTRQRTRHVVDVLSVTVLFHVSSGFNYSIFPGSHRGLCLGGSVV